MVKTGDKLERDGQVYEVLIADDNIFVIGKIDSGQTDYMYAEIYSNDKNILSLKQLHFKVVK
ncbi:MAG: hypothetical protein PVG39_24085 [Desulfobacteraceae bacterium]|jgi:hypothetical protein